jgi:hypothetical protein
MTDSLDLRIERDPVTAQQLHCPGLTCSPVRRLGEQVAYLFRNNLLLISIIPAITSPWAMY